MTYRSSPRHNHTVLVVLIFAILFISVFSVYAALEDIELGYTLGDSKLGGKDGQGKGRGPPARINVVLKDKKHMHIFNYSLKKRGQEYVLRETPKKEKEDKHPLKRIKADIPPENITSVVDVIDDPSITTEVFAVESFPIENATVELNKLGDVEFIQTCSDFDLDTFTCLGSWQKTSLPFRDASSTVEFTVSHFSAWAGGYEYEQNVSIEIDGQVSYLDPAVDRQNTVYTSGTYTISGSSERNENLTSTLSSSQNYSLNAYLSIWDENDHKGGSNTVYTGEQAGFFANYTNITKSPLQNANCTIRFSGSSSQMQWNSSSQLYEYSRSFISSGTKDWNVTCSKAGYDSLYATDTIYISSQEEETESQLQCTLRQGSCQADETKIMAMSNYTNAHAEIYSQTNYGYFVCCKDSKDIYDITTDCGTNFLNLSNYTDAHVEVPGTTDYPYGACIDADPTTIICSYTYDSCNSNQTCVLTMSDGDDNLTNMHVAGCSNSPYEEKLCCGLSDQCGDEICGPGESSLVCPEDCPGTCGDGVCNYYYGENTLNCPSDCAEEGAAIPEFSTSGLPMSLLTIIIGVFLIRRRYHEQNKKKKKAKK